ncbi:MAG: DUF2304 domain-containing protein [Flavobacteriaceae bacterium]
MIRLFSISVAISLLLLVFYLIYKKRLKEQYALLWIVLSLGILFFSLFRDTLAQLADFFGVYYAPSLLFMFSFLIFLLILIQLSTVISKLKDDVKKLTQEIGLLKNEKAHGED